jgi:hypothetical protein
MSRNIVPRVHKGSDLGTPTKNWNKLYVDAIMLRNNDLKALLDEKTDSGILTTKGDMYVATDAGTVTRLPAGKDGYILKSNSLVQEGVEWGPAPGETRQELIGDIIITVGEGGDSPTINSALESITTLYYSKYISGENCPRVTIKLLPGFVMSEQVIVDSLDLSWITIIGDDVETTINRSALTKEMPYAAYPAFSVMNGGFLPIIGQLFNMNTSGNSINRHGIFVYENSRAIILPGCGIKNAGFHGLYVLQSSQVEARETDFSGAGKNAVHAWGCSSINATASNVSHAGENGFYACYCSIINADGASDASYAGAAGVYAERGSWVNAQNINVSNAGTDGIHAQNGSIINASGANASDTTSAGIYILYGSIVNAYNATGTLNQNANTITSNGIIFQFQ